MAKLRAKQAEDTVIKPLNEAPMLAWIKSRPDGPIIAPGLDLFHLADALAAADMKLRAKQ
ncbi:hypothetical protein UAJ10_07125 [Nitrospirillum sp. BR 11164]|uniref:hypothetical protein n=1 Tax=Nitrospirillum sp. BR 11164 TaxID=3104324 RepID=UPI002AFE9D1F|nr:hypothetical protein [Nitrospirillum sp. BR 11164]MEA1648787.1 hypothetical protein [Nitrospirillum sp. BR 11164]